jgi:hypothetical protein
MTHQNCGEIIKFNLEIEPTFSKLRRAIHQKFDQSNQVSDQLSKVNQSFVDMEV